MHKERSYSRHKNVIQRPRKPTTNNKNQPSLYFASLLRPTEHLQQALIFAAIFSSTEDMGMALQIGSYT